MQLVYRVTAGPLAEGDAMGHRSCSLPPNQLT
jgi:hypothetical protein